MNTKAARLHILFVFLSIVLGISAAYTTSIILGPLFTPRVTVSQLIDVVVADAKESNIADITESPLPTLMPAPIASASALPTRQPTASASGSTRSPEPPIKNSMDTLRVGASLPSGTSCETKVAKSVWEPRPKNKKQNTTVGVEGVSVDGASDVWNKRYAGRIDGNFKGTTDEIIQWGACKWGFDVDGVRAVAVQESWWRMSTVGDSGESHGIMQVRNTYHKAAFPSAKESTAYNVDYALAWRRACFDGDFSWLREKNSTYKAGDEWGCIGAWFSGRWYDGDVSKYWSGANWYIQEVKNHKSQKTWLKKDFME